MDSDETGDPWDSDKERNTRENAGLDLSSGLRERRGVVGGLKDMKAIELRG